MACHHAVSARRPPHNDRCCLLLLPSSCVAAPGCAGWFVCSSRWDSHCSLVYFFTPPVTTGVPGSTAFRTHLATGRSGRAAAAVAAADAAAVARTAGTAHSAATYARIAALASERTAAAGTAGGTGAAWWKKGDRVRVTSGSSAWGWGLPATGATSLLVCYKIHCWGRRVACLVQGRSHDMQCLCCRQCHSADDCGVRTH